MQLEKTVTLHQLIKFAIDGIKHVKSDGWLVYNVLGTAELLQAKQSEH